MEFLGGDKMRRHHNKKIIAIASTALVFAILFALPAVFSSKAAASFNVTQTDSEIRVRLGTPGGFERVEEIVKNDPAGNNSALITFDDYLSAEEVYDSLDPSLVVTTVYIWVPNKTGRAIVNVYGGDIDTSLNSWFESLDIENEPESKYKSDILDLQENYGIFAVEAEGQNQQIQSLTDQQAISNIDLLYNEYAEELALESNLPVKYICVPEKPDGTL